MPHDRGWHELRGTDSPSDGSYGTLCPIVAPRLVKVSGDFTPYTRDLEEEARKSQRQLVERGSWTSLPDFGEAITWGFDASTNRVSVIDVYSVKRFPLVDSATGVFRKNYDFEDLFRTESDAREFPKDLKDALDKATPEDLPRLREFMKNGYAPFVRRAIRFVTVLGLDHLPDSSTEAALVHTRRSRFISEEEDRAQVVYLFGPALSQYRRSASTKLDSDYREISEERGPGYSTRLSGR